LATYGGVRCGGKVEWPWTSTAWWEWSWLAPLQSRESRDQLSLLDWRSRRRRRRRRRRRVQAAWR